MEWIDRNNAISCVRKKKIFNYLIHTHILVVIIITSQRMTFLSWEFRCCCEKEKNNRSIIFDMLVLSQICWFFFSSLVLFISYKIIWHFHRQTIVSENWNGFVDRKSPFFLGGGCAVRSYIHESRMRKERREADHSCKDEI